MKFYLDLLILILTTNYPVNACNNLSVPLIITHSLLNDDYPAITPDTWKEIDFVYYDDFPYRASYTNKVITGCQKAINRHKQFVLRCTEHISLLRPKIQIEKWLRLYGKYGWVPISIKEFGINNVHGYITAIKATTLNTKTINLNKSKSSPVIATFEQHTLTVETYTFKDVKTGSISTINVTPEHRFYITDKQIFKPIQMISPRQSLFSATGDEIKLLCKDSRTDHCGVKYKQTEGPITVYNLEVYKKKRFFVGTDQILAHNLCTKHIVQWDHYDDIGSWKSYEGSVNIENGQRYGQGTSYYANGKKSYEGAWERDKRSGFGISYYLFGGKRYEGEWLNDKWHGQGISYYVTFNRQKYRGEWKNGKQHGLGTYYYKEGEKKHEGQWLNNKEHRVISYDHLGIITKFKGFGGEPFKQPPSNMVEKLFRRNISLSGQW